MSKKGLLIGIVLASQLWGCGGSSDIGNQPMHSPAGEKLAAFSVSSNVATFSGPLSNYSITKSDTGTVVKDLKGVDGTATLSAVRSLVFSDVSVNLSISNTATTILSSDLNALIELYVAFFNRIPDADGLEYWTQKLHDGSTVEQIAETFYLAGVQNTALTGYSPTMSNSDFVGVIYKNVLGRTSVDPAGLQYWTSSLADGSKTRGSLVKSIIAAAHTFKGDTTYGWVADLLDNKIAVSLNFAVQQGLNFKSTADSISKGMELAAAITPTNISVANAKIAVLLPANNALVANAGTSQVVTTGSTVNLSGVLSSSQAMNPLTYNWTMTSLPVGSSAKLSSATVSTPNFKADVAGNYVVSLMVSDGKTNSAPAITTITAVVTSPTIIADTGFYTCANLTPSQALILFAQGHTYLDRDKDGKPCEANDIRNETKPSTTVTTTPPTTVTTVPSSSKQCYVHGYFRSSGTYVNGYYRSC